MPNEPLDGEDRTGPWIEVLGFGLLTVVLMHTVVLSPLYVSPLIMLATRRGTHSVPWGALAAAGGSLVFWLVRVGRDTVAGPGALYAEFAMIGFALLVALVLLPEQGPHMPARLLRVAGLAVAGGLALVPVMLSLHDAGALREQVVFLIGGDELALQGQVLTADEIARQLLDLLLSSVVPTALLVVAAGWYVGRLLGFRSIGWSSSAPSLERLTLPASLIWVLIAGLGAVFLGLVAAWDLALIVGANLALATTILYAAQGVGVFRLLLDRWTVSRGMRLLILAVAVISLLIPPFSAVVLIAAPALGIAKLWIHFDR